MSNDDACVGICLIDPDTGVCEGCGRTSDEIFGTTPPPPPAIAADQPAPPSPPSAAPPPTGTGRD